MEADTSEVLPKISTILKGFLSFLVFQMCWCLASLTLTNKQQTKQNITNADQVEHI